MPSTARGPFLNSRTSPSITMPLLTSPNLCRLENSHRVAERIAQPEVDSVGLLGRLLRHLDALREQLLVRLARVIGGEADPAGGRALGDQLPSGLGGAVVHRRRAGLLEQDLAPGVAGDVDGQPAHEAEVLVGVDLEAELADVEVERLVLVEHEEGVESRGLEHAPKLRGARPARFSKIAAWSRPRHREARRHGDGLAARAELARRLAHDLAERTAERPEAEEADVEADLGHAALGLAQEEHRALDAAALEVAVRRLPEGRFEDADEVRLGGVRHARERGDVQRLRVLAVHRV